MIVAFLESMETSADQQDGGSYTQSNPLFDMTDLYSFQPEGESHGSDSEEYIHKSLQLTDFN